MQEDTEMARLAQLSSLAVVCLLVLGSCSPTQTSDSAESESGTTETVPSTSSTVEPESFFGEAPALAELVAAGELPPVEERLPANPVVIEPVERVGVYGGIWRVPKVETDGAIHYRTNGYEGLVRWDLAWSRVIPNVAQSFEVNDDATVYTFRLREGMRWSDGVPYTADDIVFWYEAFYLNEETKPVPGWLAPGTTSLVVEKVDDYTFRIVFTEPYGLFLRQPAGLSGMLLNTHPRHYLEQFHASFNPDGIDDLVADAGLENWVELWDLKREWRTNPDLPTIYPWLLTDTIVNWEEPLIAERNPYYWKVDTELNQLPYIDQVEYIGFASADEVRASALNGEINMDCYRVNVASHYDEYLANAEQGEYQLYGTQVDRSNELAIALNQTHPDATVRAMFQNKDFRIGLSHAIDRRAFIDQVLGGEGDPYQIAPLEISSLYNERLATQYTQYDVNLANEYLDEAGYVEQDGEGYRLGPDGQRISIPIVMMDAGYGPDQHEMLELVRQYWQAVGIDTTVEIVSKSELREIIDANAHDAVAALVAGGIDVIGGAHVYFPSIPNRSPYGTLWAHWYQDNETGEAPPTAPRRQMELFDQIKASADPAQQNVLMSQILEIAADEFHSIGISTPRDGYCLVANDFHNVPEGTASSWSVATPGPSNASQYFIDP